MLKLTRKKSLQFHIKSDDYFATLATVLHNLEQVAEKEQAQMNLKYNQQNKQLQDLKKDLLWLQENYKLIKR